MSFPVFVEADNGHFTASLIGVPQLSVVGLTRDQAIATLKQEIQHRIEDGQLLSLDVAPIGVSDLAGKYADDPTLREICEQAYQLSDDEVL